MLMRLALLPLLVSVAPVPWAGAGELRVLSWGGDFSAAQEVAMARPFTEATGTIVRFSDSDDPHGMVHAEVQAGNVTTDVASVGQGAAMRLCDEGEVEPIDPATLVPAPDGTAAAADFMPGTLGPCFVPTDIYSTVIAYDARRAAPTQAADFFDLTRYPGRRGLSRTPQFTLELALLADGVPREQVYPLLATPEGQDRAFAKLDTIKHEVVWWEAGAQPVQLLADGEVSMTTVYNGRAFDAMVAEKQPFEIIWDGQYLDMDMFVIPVDAPNPDAAMEYLKFATDTQRLADQAKYIAYGPARKSSNELVGLYQDGVTEMAPHMPTSPEALANAVTDDPEFWADHSAELTERFNSWLAAS